ncbi:hypothetical protein [Aliifodinibius sp. S!AR15-10]
MAQAATQLHHALAEDHIASGIISFTMVFFCYLVGLDEFYMVCIGLR